MRPVILLSADRVQLLTSVAPVMASRVAIVAAAV